MSTVLEGKPPHLALGDTGPGANEAEWSGALRERFDAVVMLTWSDWHQEPRSNRYHYATRFARHLPVIFAQPTTLKEPVTSYRYEPTSIFRVDLLHFSGQWHSNASQQVEELSKALRARDIRNPLLWIYNPYLRHFARVAHAGLKVYHATEDYFGDRLFDPMVMHHVREVLRECDLVVAVSNGVAQEFQRHTAFAGRMVVATNGCDYEFLASDPGAPAAGDRVALYQGGINYRLDLNLLGDLAKEMPDWQFVFCGRAAFGPEHGRERKLWHGLLKQANVRYLGALPAEQLRRQMHQATVGIIPFGPSESIRQRSFPLKAFEYVACGLPVATVPVTELEAYPQLFHFAQGAKEFAQAIRQAAPTRHAPAHLQERATAGRAQSYEAKFAGVCRTLVRHATRRPDAAPCLKMLVLYDPHSVHVKTIEHHLRSFRLYSDHEVFYAPATRDEPCAYNLGYFDVVALHYCIRVCLPGHLSPAWEQAVKNFAGLKILFAQDEYDHTNVTRQAVADLGIQLMYTCVPPQAVEQVYPRARFPHTDFQTTLTGYVPMDLGDLGQPKPLEQRKNLIGYRGREIGWWYGDLAQEKLRIGQGMKAVCERMGVAHDIAWDAASRIYGTGWFDFLKDCRATLGTESGSNVFDFDGRLKQQVEDALRENPQASYTEVHARYLAEHEGRIVQNQISPKLFEAIALRVALVLFEGEYSGVVQPWVHYLPLKKDFSNAEEILERLQDDGLVRALTERAYQDVVVSGRYSYEAFVAGFDEVVARHTGRATCEGMLRPPPAAALIPPEPVYVPLPPSLWRKALRRVKRSVFRGLKPVYQLVLPKAVRAVIFPRIYWVRRWLAGY